MPPCRCDSLCCNRKDTFRECKECSSHHTSLINRRYVESHVFLEKGCKKKVCYEPDRLSIQPAQRGMQEMTNDEVLAAGFDPNTVIGC